MKLGYGGTKTEMDRLLADAEKISGVKYDISNLSDVYEAIHVIQTELGITGTTAEEAASTIQGSLNATKSAWKNLMVAVADGSQDFGSAVGDFVDSAGTFVDNLMPRIKDSINGIGQLVTKLAPTVIDAFVDLAPDLIAAGGDMIVALVNGIVKNIPKLVNAAKKIGKTLIDNISKIIPSIVGGLKSLVGELGATANAVLVAYAAFKTFKAAQSIINTVSTAFSALSNPVTAVVSAIGAVVGAVAILVDVFGDGNDAIYHFSEAEQELIDKGVAARDSIADATAAFEKSVVAIENETSKTRDLWAELQTLADENGNVKEADQDRAQYILGELNEALGTEYDMNDGVIGQYQQMQQEIDKLIEKRKAERLMTATQEKLQVYEDQKRQIEDELQTRQTALDTEKGIYQQRQYALNNFLREYASTIAQYTENGELDIFTFSQLDPGVYTEWQRLTDAVQQSADAVASSQDNYTEANRVAQSYYETLANYEEAERLIAEGNYTAAQELLAQDTANRYAALQERGQILDSDIAKIKAEYEHAAWYADWYQQQVESGIKGFDPVGAAEAAHRAEELRVIWENLEKDAQTYGKNMDEGLAAGLDAHVGIVKAAAGRVADAARLPLQAKLEIASPSKLMRRFGRFVDEGLALGMEDELDAVKRMADRVGAYATPDVAAGYTTTTSAGAYSNRSTSIGSIVLNVDGSGVANVERLADLVADRINRDVLRRVAAT